MQSEKCIILRSGYISRDKNQDLITKLDPQNLLPRNSRWKPETNVQASWPDFCWIDWCHTYRYVIDTLSFVGALLWSPSLTLCPIDRVKFRQKFRNMDSHHCNFPGPKLSVNDPKVQVVQHCWLYLLLLRHKWWEFTRFRWPRSVD